MADYKPIEIWYDDGGRAAAGFKGETGDCVTRAIAIALERPYLQVYNEINEWAKKERQTRNKGISNARKGVYKATSKKYLESLGWEWVPTMGIGTGCKVHLRKEELPSGRIIVQLSKHMSAVVDGIVHDTQDPSRGGSRCVYGFFRKMSADATPNNPPPAPTGYHYTKQIGFWRV